jgi:hypothetical protein
MILWNAAFCESGDHTLAAAAHAISDVVKVEADDYLVFVLSDANLGAYGITPTALSQVLLADARVRTFAIFIAAESQAAPLTRQMPVGHGFVCTDTAMLPRVFKQIMQQNALTAVRAKL